MEYSDTYMLIENGCLQNMHQNSQFDSSSRVKIEKKICKKKYQKALKWTHLPSPFSENQTPEKFLLYGNLNLFTNYSEDAGRCPYSSECIVENGYYKLDKVTMQDKKGIEIQVSQLKPCLDKFQFLINLFKRYQSSKYADLANILGQYQKYIKQEFERSNLMHKQLKKDKSLQEKFQLENNNFQQKIISDIYTLNNQSNKTSYFSYQSVSIDYKTSQPEIKKIGTSESLINLLGNSIQNEYQNLLLKMRKQQVFNKNQENHLFKSQDSIQKAIFLINNIINQEKSYTYQQTLITRDGLELSCTVKAQIFQNTNLNYVKHYESRDQHIVLFTYTFDKDEIQNLQSKRENISQLTQTFSPKQYSFETNLGLENLDESQASNFNIDQNSETLSQHNLFDFNNHYQQLQTNQQTPLYNGSFISKFKNSPSFSPLSLNSNTSLYKMKREEQSDYTRISYSFINKYYKHLLKKLNK